MKARQGVTLLKETFREWNRDQAPRLAAALSYYTLFSVAPLLIIAIAIAGLVFGQDAARGEVVAALRDLLGSKAAEGIETMIRNAAANEKSGVISSIFGIAALVMGAAGVFGHLKESLNAIWAIEPRSRGVWAAIRGRFLSFTMVVGVGFLLLVSLLVSAALSATGRFLSDRIPLGDTIWMVLNFAISLAVVTLLFAAVFRFIPDKRIPWEDVRVGAAFTAVLFVAGKFLIGIYLGRSAVASTYGAAASLVILLLWIYYSSLILFFGAEFTEVWNRERTGAGARKPVALLPEPRQRHQRRPPRPARLRGNTLIAIGSGLAGLLIGVLLGAIGVVLKTAKGLLRIVTARM